MKRVIKGPRPKCSEEEEVVKGKAFRRFGRARIYVVIVMVSRDKLIYDLPGALIRFLQPVQDRPPLVQQRQVAGQPRAWNRGTGGVVG